MGDLAASSEKDVKLIISFDKSEYKKTEPINVDIKLNNTGKEAVLVNKRFFINSEDSPAKNREIYLSVISPSGSKLKYRMPVQEIGLPKTDYFTLLKPQESASMENKRDLRNYFDMAGIGEYKISAVYQNIYGQEIGLDVFKGPVSSDTVTIKVNE